MEADAKEIIRLHDLPLWHAGLSHSGSASQIAAAQAISAQRRGDGSMTPHGATTQGVSELRAAIAAADAVTGAEITRLRKGLERVRDFYEQFGEEGEEERQNIWQRIASDVLKGEKP